MFVANGETSREAAGSYTRFAQMTVLGLGKFKRGGELWRFELTELLKFELKKTLKARKRKAMVEGRGHFLESFKG